MYYELTMSNFNITLLRVLSEKNINIESVYLQENLFKIVVNDIYLNEVCDILKNLYETFCVKRVYLVDFEDKPGSLYNLLSNNKVNITNLYVAENNRFVISMD